MKLHLNKVFVLIAMIIFGFNHRTFSQTLVENVYSNAKIDSNQSLMHTSAIEMIDSLSLSETKETLPIEKKIVVSEIKRPNRCHERIVSPPVSIFLFDPESTIKRYSSKDILRYRF